MNTLDPVRVAAQRVVDTLSTDAFVKPSAKNANAGFVDMRDWYALLGEVSALRNALEAQSAV